MWRVFRGELGSFSDHLSPAFHHKFTIKKPRSATTFSQKPLQKRPFTIARKKRLCSNRNRRPNPHRLPLPISQRPPHPLNRPKLKILQPDRAERHVEDP